MFFKKMLPACLAARYDSKDGLRLPSLVDISVMGRSDFSGWRSSFLPAIQAGKQLVNHPDYLLSLYLRGEEAIQAKKSPHADIREVPGRGSVNLLSSRELEVLEYIARGYKNEEIALELAISKSTVKTHIQNIFMSLNTDDRAHACMLAVFHGLMDPGKAVE